MTEIEVDGEGIERVDREKWEEMNTEILGIVGLYRQPSADPVVQSVS